MDVFQATIADDSDLKKKHKISGSNIIIWVTVFCGFTVPSSSNVGHLVVLTGKSYNKINGLEL